MKKKRTSPTSMLQKLENIENELREVREYLAQNMIAFVNADDRTKDLKLEYTMEDLYEAFGPSKQSYANRINRCLIVINY